MADLEIKRGYEVLPDNNVRFGIRITNVSDLAISDVEVILDYVDSLFKLEGERVQKLGNIPPSNTRTVEFVLKPLGCVHKVNIEALISYRDSKWNKHVETMHPKEVHCVCPFLKGKAMPRAEFLKLSGTGHSAETGLNFKGVSVDRLASYLVQTCKSRHHKVDDYSVDGGRMLYLASESIGEKAYYLLTALIKEDDGLIQVMLRVVSDKSHGLNGFLNETVAELRHVVSTVQSAQEVGIVKKEQVINIIDSVVQRSSFGGAGGESGASVNIEGSLVQRTEFNAGEDRRVEEERLKKGKEKQRKEEEEKQLELVKRQAQEEAERKKKREEEERLRKEQEEARNKRLREEQEKKKHKSRNTIMLAIVLGALLVGFLAFATGSGDTADVSSTITQPKTVTESIESTVLSTSTQPGAVSESTDPISSQQSEVEPEVSQTPASSSNQKTSTNSIGMEFVLIPVGEFKMGSPSGEGGRDDDEGPLHTVNIEKAYYLGKYEVTQKQWREVMGNNPSRFKGDDLPVERVSWNDVQEFIEKLNEKEGTIKYRLPSEAEWEYAARAGTTTRYSFGDSESRLGEYAWYDDNSGSKTHTVGQKKPNPWGLYDMHGNVWEWTQDWYHSDYKGAPTDGSAWEIGGGSNRVFRGGSWDREAQACRLAYRNYFEAPYGSYLGFRLLQES